MTEEEMTDIVKSIAIKPGGALVIKAEYRAVFESAIRELSNWFSEDDIVMFFVNELDDIRTIDEDGMRKLGWVRAND